MATRTEPPMPAAPIIYWIIHPRLKRLLIVIGIFVAIPCVAFIYKTIQTTQSREALQAAEIQAITRVASKHFLFPKDEIPTLATVNDASVLIQSQHFFLNAHNGDKLLIYAKSNQAILYRPSTDMVINAGLFQYSTPQQTTIPQPPLRVEIRNGTHTDGAASAAAGVLAAYSEYAVVKTRDAKDNDYAYNIIITPQKEIPKSAIDFLTDHFSASLARLPSGETPTTADILIILGDHK